MVSRRSFIAASGCAAASLAAPVAWAQASRGSIRFICPFAAGASYDFMTRTIAESVGRTLGRPAIVDNRPGAGGLLAVRALQSAGNEGSTSVLQTSSSFVSLPVFLKDANYDPVKDFAPVACFVDTFSVVLLHSSVPAKNVAELVAWAKANPKVLSAGTAGPNTSGDIWTSIFAKRADIDILRVPYRGAAPMLLALEGGEVKLAITTYSEVLRSAVNAGKLRILGVTSAKRVPLLPEVPSISESLPTFAIEGNWVGLHALRSLPAAEVSAISGAVRKATEEPDFRKKMAGLFAEPRYQGPDAFTATVAHTKATWDRLAQELKVVPS